MAVREIDMLKKMFNFHDNDIVLIDRSHHIKKYARPYLLCYGELVTHYRPVNSQWSTGFNYRSKTKHQYRVAYASLDNVMEKVREIVGQKHLDNVYE